MAKCTKCGSSRVEKIEEISPKKIQALVFLFCGLFGLYKFLYFYGNPKCPIWIKIIFFAFIIMGIGGTVASMIGYVKYRCKKCNHEFTVKKTQ